MDDINAALNSLLSSPDTVNMLKNLIGGLPGGAGPEKEEKEGREEPSPAGDPMMDVALKLMPLLSSMGRDDDRTHLIKALRPHLSPERRSRADEALRILQLTSLLPLLKDQGIL